MYFLTNKLYLPIITLALVFSLIGRAGPARDEVVFNRVMEKLDTGGVFLFVLKGEDFTRVLPDKLDKLWEIITKAAPEEEKQGDDFDTAQGVYQLVHSMLVNSGITELNAVGMSSKRLESGLFHNRLVLDGEKSENAGLIWRLGGSENQPLESFKMFPEDAVLAYRGVFNMSELFSWVQNEINQSELPEARQAVAEGLKNAKNMGIDLEKILASTTGEFGWLATMNREQRYILPETDEKIEIPHIEFAIYLGCKDDELFNLINNYLKTDSLDVSAVDKEDIKLRTINVPEPGEIPFAPTLARFGDYLVIASTKEMAERIFAVNNGEEPTLFTASSEFQRLHAGLPAEGTSFYYLSAGLMEEYENFIFQVLTQDIEEEKSQWVIQEVMELFQVWQMSAAVSVTTVNPHGWVIDSRSSDSLRQIVVIPPIVAFTTGMSVVSVAIPSFIKARSTAQRNLCINNMRMLDSAKQQWAIENGAGPDAQPSFDDIRQYLDSDLSCPQGGTYQLNSVGEKPTCSVHGTF